MKKLSIFGTSLAIAAIASVGFAQTPYLTGQITNPNWQPGIGKPYGAAEPSDPLPLLVNDGSGIWSLTLSLAQLGIDPPVTGAPLFDEKREWKVAGPGFSNPNTPAQNLFFYVPTGYTNNVTFTWDQNNNWVYYDVVPAMATAVGVKVVGSFQANPFNGEDSDAVILTDGGGGIYTGSITGLDPGIYSFKGILGDNFDRGEFGSAGFGGENIDVTTFSGDIAFTLNVNTQRLSAVDPNATAGPPFFAASNAWDGFLPMSINDNGDWFARSVVVETPGEYVVKVLQGVGRQFPESGSLGATGNLQPGGTPFTTTAPDEEIVVILDRRTYTDGYVPATDFVVVLKEEAAGQRGFTMPWTRVQPVGTLDSTFGAGDWNNDQDLFVLADNGTAPDTAAGDQIWSGTFNAFNGAGNPVVKAVLRTADTVAADDGYWAYQAGGTNNGLTRRGDNESVTFVSVIQNQDYTFKVDAVTGRVSFNTAGTKAQPDPDRSAPYFGAQVGDTDGSVTTSVMDWTLY